MRARSLVSFICVAVLAGCSAQQLKTTDPESVWRLEIAQTAQGKYVVCDACPKKTPKTPYRQDQEATSVLRAVRTGDGQPQPHTPPTTVSVAADLHTKATDQADKQYGDLHNLAAHSPASEHTSNAENLLLTLQFPFDVARIQPEHRKLLAEFASNIWPTLAVKSLLLVGRTDDIGPKHYNDNLARKRAESVATVLNELGLSDIRIEAEGKCCYIADNATAAGRARNRRVDIRVQTSITKEK